MALRDIFGKAEMEPNRMKKKMKMSPPKTPSVKMKKASIKFKKIKSLYK